MASKYEGIADDLRRKIRAGRLPAGSRLPGEEALATEYGVTTNTLRRAVDVLRMEGLVEKRHGTATYVRKPRQRLVRTTDRYQWEKDRVKLPVSERESDGATEQDTGLKTNDLDFYAEFSIVPADAELAELFGIDEGSRLLKRVYHTRKRMEQAPMGTGASYLVYDVAAQNPDLLDSSNEPWPGGTQHQLSTIGIEIDHIIDEVVSRPPTTDEAKVLDILPGEPVIAVRKISVSTKSQVVEIADAIWSGDRIKLRYTTALKRWQ